MTDKTFYAVVDLETTGSQPTKGDRIIQFGCVLIQDGQIVQTFETKVNPLKKIPENIQHLTGITNQMVANAPFFNDVSGFIWNLLQDCVFVAHNVLFDYRFLNEELTRAGFPELHCPAMDTVELAQILFPKEESYSLADLSESFGLIHDRPHNAIDDAAATAELLLMYMKKAKRLPLVTLEHLRKLAEHLTMDTSLFFEKVLEQLKDRPADLPEHLMVVEGIALRKQVPPPPVSYRQEKAYPLQSSDKDDMFEGALSVRPDQQEMMNATYEYFLETNPRHHLAVEAPAGIGKSLGYLLPSVFLSSPEHPIVISTYTTLLQQQLLEKDLKELAPFLPFPVEAAVLKSRFHYLSLANFSKKLNSGELESIEALYSAKLLVWLTETTTGDLDEIGTINEQHTFWTDIRTTKKLEELSGSKWDPYEFYKVSRDKLQKASIIVTNHSFLCHDLMRETAELPNIEKIIIDEAHHLPATATQTASQSFSFQKLRILLQTIGSMDSESSLVNRLARLFTEKVPNLELLDANRAYLENEIDEWVENWLYSFRSEANQLKEKNERIEIAFDRKTLPVQIRKQAKIVLIQLEEMSYLSDRVMEKLLENAAERSKAEQDVIEEAYVVFEQVAEELDVLRQIFRPNDGMGVYWMSFMKKTPKKSFRIVCYEPESRKFLKKTLGNIPHVVYTSGTLSVNGHFSFFENQLGTQPLETLQLSAPFDYKKQARIWVPENLQPIKGLSKREYAEMLTQHIVAACAENEENTLVLFNSLETLERVYQRLSQADALKRREIYAQGVSGSRERILKRFFRSKGAILLGADSFWEGIDLPGKSLSIVIVTRLPFESPDRPLVQSRQELLKKENKNPFTEDSLPRAILKMKQGFGRLIRSKDDKGVLVVLDDRFLRSAYARQFQQALPDEVPVELVEKEELSSKLRKFLSS